MNPFSWIKYSLHLIRERYLPSYIVINLLFYGCIALGMVLIMVLPSLRGSTQQSVKEALNGPVLAPVQKIYISGNVVAAAAITFGVNLILATAMALSLPSLFIPFIGIAIGMLRGLFWGLVFGPAPNGMFGLLATHWPVMVLEGQGYVLGMLAVYIHGKGILRPASVGATGFWQGYRRGFVESMRMYPLIALVLAISAIYEAAEVIYLMHH